MGSKLLRTRRSRKQRDRFWPLIGNKNKTSIPVSRRIGSLRLASQE